MAHYTKNEIDNLDHLFKINLINSCSGYKSANLIGTKSANGNANVAIFSSVTHMGSNPALFGFFLRPNPVPRNTYKNIKESRFFTVNHIHEGIIADAHHTSAKYHEDISEFDMTSLKSEYRNEFYAPFVVNSPLQMAMKYVEEYHIKSNNTILVVGEVQDLYIKNNLVQNDGFINLSDGNVAAINGLDGYTIPTLKKRFGYQKPKQSQQ